MPSSSSARTSSGSTREHGRLGEGGVQEVHGAQVGPAPRPASARAARSGSPARSTASPRAGPGHHDVGHGPVVGPVALPGRPPVAVEAGPVRQVEEMVVAVPERGVGDDVVGLPVGVVVDDDRDAGRARPRA